MNHLTQNPANNPEDSGDRSESSLDSVLGDLLPAQQITSSAWEGWWWGNPETRLD
ncbi:hypothetical protein ACW0JT_03320 [Arthrobacter sp. SA17]